MISGFLAIRNGLRGGYPFREAIASALPAVDEFVIVDGMSDDGTLPLLQQLAARYGKIRLSQHAWDGVSVNGSAIRNAQNFARGEARGEYLLQVDANEILPPEDVEAIRHLPSRFPRKELFALPYLQLLGRLEFTSEMRWRFARNLPTIRSLYDGWTLGYSLRARDFLRPREWKRMLGRGALRLAQDHLAVDLPEQSVVLPRPIFRYYGLFPESFAAKMQSKQFFQRNPAYRDLSAGAPGIDRSAASYRSTGDWDAFWESMYELTQTVARGGSLNKNLETRRLLPVAMHPEIIQHQLGRAAYDPAAPLP